MVRGPCAWSPLPPVRLPPPASRLPPRADSSGVAVQNRRVSVDPTIAQKWPVATRILDQRAVAFGHQHRWLGPGLDDDSAKWIRDERVTEELDAVSARLIFVAD